MAITATTLSAACTANDTTVALTATTGVTVPNFQTGVGIIYLLVDQEFMLVVGVNTTSKIANVIRGVNGSAAVAHVVNSQVQIAGTPADFALVTEQLVSETVSTLTGGASIQQAIFLAGSADAVPSTVPGFYVVKTAGVDAMTLAAPTAAQEGNVIAIWSDTANAHTVTAPSAIFAVGALKTVATFPAARGAGIELRACNLFWHVLSTSGTGTNSGPIVWT